MRKKLKGIDYFNFLTLEEKLKFQVNFLMWYHGVDIKDYMDDEYTSFFHFMAQAFNWKSTSEGKDFWLSIAERDEKCYREKLFN